MPNILSSITLLTAALFLYACGGSEDINETEFAEAMDALADSVEIVDTTPYVPAEPPFKPVEANYETTDFIIPEGFTYTILFEQKNSMVTRADGEKFPAKGYHDMNQILPIPGEPNMYWCYTSHESRYQNADLGDAGGGTIYKVSLAGDGTWSVAGDYHHVDFSGVGGTLRNCGGYRDAKRQHHFSRRDLLP